MFTQLWVAVLSADKMGIWVSLWLDWYGRKPIGQTINVAERLLGNAL